MDLLEVKSRIAEALVESIFRRARYQIRPFRNNTSPLRFGREDFSPDFRVSSETDPDNGGGAVLPAVHRLAAAGPLVSAAPPPRRRSTLPLPSRPRPRPSLH